MSICLDTQPTEFMLLLASELNNDKEAVDLRAAADFADKYLQSNGCELLRGDFILDTMRTARVQSLLRNCGWTVYVSVPSKASQKDNLPIFFFTKENKRPSIVWEQVIW